MPKPKYDISSENLDLFFDHQLSAITPFAKEQMTPDIRYKIFKGGGKINHKATTRLSFFEKLFVLWKTLKKRIWIVVEDEESGMTPEQFCELREGIKRRDYGQPKMEGIKAEGIFITGNKDLCDTFMYLENAVRSPAYNFLMKTKNAVPNKTTEAVRKMVYITRFLAFYEGQKKSWEAAFGLNIPEWYVLLGLYHGKDVNASYLHKDLFKRSHASSPAKIKLAFGSLQRKGFLNKTGESRGATLQITALGKEMVNKILKNYALNC